MVGVQLCIFTLEANSNQYYFYITYKIVTLSNMFIEVKIGQITFKIMILTQGEGGDMPRRARISLAGVPHHIIQIGNNRSVCFYSEEDYRHYLE